jgi:acyl-coenzyme A thioesterase PaaI-like protein
VNLLRPGVGERFVARAKVLKPGRTLTAVQADVFAIAHGAEKLVASLQGTMICKRHTVAEPTE